MKSYDTFSGDVSMRRIQREVQVFKAHQMIDQSATHFHGLKFESFYDGLAQRMILELQAKIASKKFDVKTVRFPDGAWQAIKHAVYGSQWMMYQFVRSWLKKHPVRYIEVTMEANAYHPDIAIPDYATFADIAIRERMVGGYE